MAISTRTTSLAALTLALATAFGCGVQAVAPGTTRSAAALFAAGARELPVVIEYSSRAQLRKMAELGVDFHGFDLATRRTRTVLDADRHAALSRLGLKITADTRRARNQFDPAYHTYAEMESALRGLAARRPELAELVDVGDSWEKTQNKANRDIWGLHIGKKGAGRPVVLFAGCHHARELVTPEMVLKLAQHLIDGYGKDPEVTGLVDTRDIWLVPMVNPDGHVLAERGQNQRKNTNNVTGGKSRIGVDLNRNYGAPEWGNVGSSGNPESDTFHGKGPFSEPETQAMRDLMRRIKPVYLLTFHSFSNVVLWPWGYTEAPPPDPRLELVGKKLGELSGYEAGQSSTALYATAGDDTDWAFAELGVLAYTVEVGGWGDGFDPPYSSVAKFWRENLPMMMFTLKTADDPAAAAGPALRDGRAVASEYFLDRPGRPGTGAATAPAVAGRRLVWGHARDARGVWGPWEIRWSR